MVERKQANKDSQHETKNKKPKTHSSFNKTKSKRNNEYDGRYVEDRRFSLICTQRVFFSIIFSVPEIKYTSLLTNEAQFLFHRFMRENHFSVILVGNLLHTLYNYRTSV